MRYSLALLALLLSGCGGGQPVVNPPTPPAQNFMDPAQWTFLYSPGMSIHPGAGWTFDFPVAPSSVHYLVTPYSKPLTTGNAIAFTAEIQASDGTVFSARVDPNDSGTTPPAVRLMIQRRDDDLLTEFWRWWSVDASMVLQSGTQTIAVSLDPHNWSSVFGRRADTDASTLAGFQECSRNIGKLGLTFGGEFYGHGVRLDSGQATFMLRNFEVR